MSLTAFFPSAGYGTRLRPLTNRVPKPAIPFLGQSALELNVRAVDAALKPQQRITNAHHLPDAIRAIADPLGLETVFEREILGTGGCLANLAKRLAETDHFLVHNADLVHGVDLGGAWQAHRSSGALATLVGIHRDGAPNTLSVDAHGSLHGRHGLHALLGVHGFDGYAGDPHESKRLTFAGIAFYRRDFLAFVPNGASDIKPWWMAALRGGGKIRVVDAGDAAWHDFGTPQGLWEALKFRMEQAGVTAHGYAARTEEGKPTRVSNEASIDLPPNLRNVAVYEAPRIPLEAGTTNLLTGLDFDWKVRP